jgi:hypothetical protein
MDMDERWVSRSPETMLETFHWFRGEGFGLIVEDLLRLPEGSGVIAEGFRLLPRLVQPLLAVPGQAVWLCPAPGFRRAAFASRGFTAENRRKDQRSGAGPAQPARTRPVVHRAPPRGSRRSRPARHRGGRHDDRGRPGRAGGAGARAVSTGRRHIRSRCCQGAAGREGCCQPGQSGGWGRVGPGWPRRLPR